MKVNKKSITAAVNNDTAVAVKPSRGNKREMQREIDKALGVKRSDAALTIPADKILMLEEDRDDNPRNRNRYGKDAEGANKMTFEELKESIKVGGQQQAIFVYFNTKHNAYALAHGWRRLTAMKELLEEGNELAPVKCERVSDNKEERMFLHFTANMSDELTDEEKAVGIHRLNTVYKINLMTISKRLGMEYQKVAKLASMMTKASTPLVEAMLGGEVSVSTVQALVKEAADTHEQNELLEEGKKNAQDEAKEKAALRKTKKAAKLAEQQEEERLAELAAAEAATAAEAKGEEAPKVKGKPGRKSTKTDEIPDVEPGRIYTADDITDAEVEGARVKASHIPRLITKVSMETRLTIALTKAFDMGDKVDQSLVARFANVLIYLRDPEFTPSTDNIVNMFAALEDGETSELFDK